jgi:Family of unknown function (DUF6463)
MKHWIGRWLCVVAIIHVFIAVVVHRRILFLILERGVFNTVTSDPVIGAFVWSVFFGAVAFIGGIVVNALEKSSNVLPKSLGWSLLTLSIVGVVLVPVSGFWLIFPPAMSILLRKSDVRAF